MLFSVGIILSLKGCATRIHRLKPLPRVGRTLSVGERDLICRFKFILVDLCLRLSLRCFAGGRAPLKPIRRLL